MDEMRNAYKTLIGKTEGKKSFGRRKHRWERVLEFILEEQIGSGL
jgi:hypothetical protein